MTDSSLSKILPTGVCVDNGAHDFRPMPTGTHIFCTKCGHNLPLTPVVTQQQASPPRRQKICVECKKIFTPGEFQGGCVHKWKRNRCEYCDQWTDEVARQPSPEICLMNSHFADLEG
jgi:hypothetical protein